jgi:flagellar hook-basal body complex protein FliE
MDFVSAIQHVVPGTFVPDISAADDQPNISAIPSGATGDAGAVSGTGTESSFKDTVKQLLSDVNDKINTSDQNIRDLATGATNDTGKVVTSVEEANLALQFTMAMRTKLLDAYTEINRITV